jgi:GT2 family glycosyltransferase
MTRVAVLITVFNRREITLKGLRSLSDAIAFLGVDFRFDIYMTDDGSTDSTTEAVKKEFPDIRIINGNGNLFWGGGMNMAWKTAVAGKEKYDYFLWYNDDSDIYPDALRTMFDVSSNEVVITGAFRDNLGKLSYGGKTKDEKLIEPNGKLQEVVNMNGNLVLIPYEIFLSVGMIDDNYIHGGGDFDYGFRVREKGYKVFLAPKYVGIADRHDDFIPKYCNRELSLSTRWKILHNPMNSPKIHFRYNWKREGAVKAIAYFLIGYIGVLSPSFYIKVKSILKGNTTVK